jgi:hypothetical protein
MKEIEKNEEHDEILVLEEGIMNPMEPNFCGVFCSPICSVREAT